MADQPDHVLQTIATLQSDVEKLLEEARETMRFVNKLCKRAGIPIKYPEADTVALGADQVPLSIASDQFYGQTLAGSMRTILELRRALKQGPASVNDIYDTLLQGGFKFDTSNEENRKRNLRISLGKNTAQFHKLPNGMFGLTEWYPNVRTKRPLIDADQMLEELKNLPNESNEPKE